MTLATSTDIETRLGRDLTPDEEAQIDGLLTDVSSAIRLYCGQSFERGTYTTRARVKRGMVCLSQRPVVSVESVTDRFGNDVAYTWDGLDRVHINTIRYGCAPIQVVDVEYVAGPEVVPEAIVGVACSVAMRSLGINPMETAVTQESIDGYSYTIGSSGGARAFGILPNEAKVLDVFRRPYGNIRAAW